MNIILLGGPGAGKGTQSDFLVKKYGMLHISTGDLLRDAVANKTEEGLIAKSYMDAGNLVPDEVILNIMREKFSSEDISKGLILDGFPRTIAQAEALDTMMRDINSKIDLAVLIDTPTDLIIKRICSRRMCKDCGAIGSVINLSSTEAQNYVCPECGGEMFQRDDDNESTVLNRIQVYEQNTAPLIKYYEKENKLVKVDGSPSTPKEVFENLEKVLH